MTQAKTQTGAAFFDFDGTLCSTNVLHAYLFTAREQPNLVAAASKLVGLAARLPAYWLKERKSRQLFNEAFFKRYAGEPRDRMVFLNQRLYEEAIQPAIFAQGRALVDRCKEAGLRCVLVTGALEGLAASAGQDLGMDDWVGNRLVYRDGVATGEVEAPLLAGVAKAEWMRSYCRAEGIDLEASYAYSDSFSDLPMLTVVGRPSVVNPDARLAQTARENDWPILEFID